MRSHWGEALGLIDAGPPVDDGCLEWPWARSKAGYGVVTVEGKQTYAHRASLVRHLGLRVADIKGLLVCHRCDNPSCFWPDHLFLGTAKNNSMDMAAKGRDQFSRRTHCPQGHPYSGDNLVVHYRKNRDGPERICRTCSNSASRLAKARRRQLERTQ